MIGWGTINVYALSLSHTNIEMGLVFSSSRKSKEELEMLLNKAKQVIFSTPFFRFFFFLTSIHRSMQASVQLVCKGKKFRFWDYEKLSNWCTHFEKFPFENIFNMILWSSLSTSKVRLQMPNLRRMKKILKFNSFPITIFCSLQSYLHDYF